MVRLGHGKWSARSSARGLGEEEARAHLQARLTTLYKVMFWANAALLAFLKLMYWRCRVTGTTSSRATTSGSSLIATIAIVIMGFVWRVLLVGAAALVRTAVSDRYVLLDRHRRRVRRSRRCSRSTFRPSAYTCLTYQCFALLTRALLVPSTGRRTAIVDARLVRADVGQRRDRCRSCIPNHPPELPGPAYARGLRRDLDRDDDPRRGRLVDHLRPAPRGRRRGRSSASTRSGALIGKGGMGEVYLAHHVMLRRPTAIKLLRARPRRRPKTSRGSSARSRT